MSICPYCGEKNGVHIWAGSGQCPGMNPEVRLTYAERLIIDKFRTVFENTDEMQKVFDIVTKTLALREAEIEQLKADRAALLSEEDSMNYQFGKLKALLARAADALACHNQDHLQDDLIAELRKV